MSDKKATLSFDGKTIELDSLTGTENETGLDITKLRAETGLITLDPAYGNTGSCTSDITFIDGGKGILRYRGYAIEELCEKSDFLETAFLVLYGHLPNVEEKASFQAGIDAAAGMPSDIISHLNAFPKDAPPMATLSSLISVLAAHNTDDLGVAVEGESFTKPLYTIMAQVLELAAGQYRVNIGKTPNTYNPKLSYAANFMHLMFSEPGQLYEVLPAVEKAMDLFLILHADHEQNCSTSTVRIVGSSQSNLFSSVSAGVGALWGPLHGGANCEVIKMLNSIYNDGIAPSDFVAKAKDKSTGVKLMGFGHRVYKNFDPRAKVLKVQVDNVLEALNIDDPLMGIAKELEEMARSDSYFVDRNLYPNVDFYSGILLKALNIPIDMFTVLFAIGRIPGWIANYRELHTQGQRIGRPRQIYTGSALRDYVSLDER